MTIRGRSAIVGFHELPTRKEYPGRSTLGLLAEAAGGAIRDAGLRKEDVYGLIAPEAVNSVSLAEGLGMKPRYTTSLTVRGASGAAAIASAAAVIAAEIATSVLCVFGESRPRSSFRLRGAAEGRGGGGSPSLTTEWEAPFGPAIAANGGYGLMKQRYMFEYGATQEQFAKCVVDERFNAERNANAVWEGQPITIEDVLTSRSVNDPLHLLECVMPCSGAAAVIVTSAERARTLPRPPVYILGVGGPATRHDAIWQEEDLTTTPAVVTAAAALRMARSSVQEIEFAKFYDCYTILVMLSLEDAGICPKGEIGPFYAATDTTYQGRFPINTDGGQLGGGQPGGNAGGFRHVVEATRQIMRRAGDLQVARSDLCLVNGSGGTGSVMCSLVLGSGATL